MLTNKWRWANTAARPYVFFIVALTIGFLIFFFLLIHHKNRPLQYPPCHQQLSKQTCEKIGQMLIVGFNGQDNSNMTNIKRIIKDYHVGGVILFKRNIQSPEQVKNLNSTLQQYSEKIRQENNFPPLGLLITIDQEGGMIDRLPFHLGFPLKTFIPQALGANEENVLEDPQKKKMALLQTEQYALKMADELVANQFNTNFIPCIDININPLNPIIGGIGRSFSSNPQVVCDQAQAFINVFNAKNLIAALKHFPGHGSSDKDTHLELVDVTETYQKEKELLPYQVLIKNGFQDLIMTTHVINGQLDKTQCKKGSVQDNTTWCPGTLSYATLTTLLRENLGFKGVIVSDDMTMGAIAKEYPLEIAFEKAINAGVDMFIIANNKEDQTETIINTIAKLVAEGKIKETEINRAYANIVELKTRKKLND